MKKEEAISYLQQLYPNGGHCWLDEQRIEAIDMAVKALQEEPNDVVDKYLYGKEPELVDEDDLPTKKDYRERYKRIAESEAFKKTHEGMSIGEVIPVDGTTPKVFEDMLNAKTAAESLGISFEEHDRIVDECIFGEEPVSNDLGDYINELSKQFPEVSFAKLSRIAVRVAKWQKEREDSGLTVDDIMKLDALLIEMWNQSGNKYQEVLKRFKDFKEGKRNDTTKR